VEASGNGADKGFKRNPMSPALPTIDRDVPIALAIIRTEP